MSEIQTAVTMAANAGQTRKFDLQLFADEPAPAPAPAPSPSPAPSSGAPSPAPANPAQGNTPVEKTFTQADLDRVVKERLDRETKKHTEQLTQVGSYKQAYDAMVEAGLIDRNSFSSPADVVAYVRQQAAETARTRAVQTGDTTEYARVMAQNAAKSEVLDARIDMAAERLAEKDPLFADIKKHLEEIRPLARLMGGDVKKAYIAHFGDDYITALSAKKEAEIIANLEQKASRKGETGESGGEAEALGLTATELDFAKNVFGMDPKRYKAMKDAQDFGDYRKIGKK